MTNNIRLYQLSSTTKQNRAAVPGGRSMNAVTAASPVCCTPTVLTIPKMQDTSYPVYLNLKVPGLAKTFYWLFWICLIFLALFGLYMLPAKHSSDEMKAAYFVLTTTEFEKKVFVFALLGTPFFFVLYRLSRYKRQALLTLLSDKIEIDNYKTITSYAVEEITHISCNDAMTSDGFPKGKLTIDFRDKDKKVTSVTLIDYSQSDQLMNTLLTYENIKFNVTNFLTNPEVLDE